MAKPKLTQAPLILRSHRLMDAFAKSDDERDFYLDRQEGFLVFVDLDRSQAELDKLQGELEANSQRYAPIPKLTYYEVKKIMETFTNEKVYDIDTKEKLLDIIGGKDAREQFLEFLHDHHSELDKWQQFYQERSRIRIIEWLRSEELSFVFEEDLDLPVQVVEKLKKNVLQTKVGRDIASARKTIEAKAASYYSNEALNPRPKRGRPPKHQAKIEVELRYSPDLYTSVPLAAQPFLFIPEISSLSSITFSSKYDSEEEFLASLRSSKKSPLSELEELSQKLSKLRNLSSQVHDRHVEATIRRKAAPPKEEGETRAPPMRRLVKRVKPKGEG
ncbi:MAG: UPF0158 family protein [Verrucomicrobia bacterium]|nr:UPF0158 family protein [Verrucomicrobiota bacterium]